MAPEWEKQSHTIGFHDHMCYDLETISTRRRAVHRQNSDLTNKNWSGIACPLQYGLLIIMMVTLQTSYKKYFIKEIVI